MNREKPAVTERTMLESRYNNARHNILVVFIMTVINMVLLLTGGDSYFLFSAQVPYDLTVNGMYLCGKLPEEYYEGGYELYEFLPNEFLVIMVSIAAVITLLYLVFWIFSKKQKVGFMIAALVLFILDTISMITSWGAGLDSLLDIVFHVWVIVSLCLGVSSAAKLKKMPVEETVEVPAEAPAEMQLNGETVTEEKETVSE